MGAETLIGVVFLLAAALLVALGDDIPVDHVPPGVQVVGASILILEVVGVFPDIVAHDRVCPLHVWTILVGAGSHLQRASLTKHEPDPAGAKALDPRILEGSLELIEAAE